MVSARRAARAGLDRPQVADHEELPEWFMRFRPEDWPLSGLTGAEPADPADRAVYDYARSRRLWKMAKFEWIAEQGLVAWGMPGLTHEEFKRIEREEPHRVFHWPRP